MKTIREIFDIFCPCLVADAAPDSNALGHRLNIQERGAQNIIFTQATQHPYYRTITQRLENQSTITVNIFTTIKILA